MIPSAIRGLTSGLARMTLTSPSFPHHRAESREPAFDAGGRVMPRLSGTGQGPAPAPSPAARYLRGSLLRHTLRATGRACAAAARLVLLPLAAACLALAPAAPAMAQVHVLVSNIGQSDQGTATQRALSQRFTTGMDAGGYLLDSVEVAYKDNDMNAFDLSVCTVDSSGNPTEICTELMPPDSFGKPGTLTFTAPADLFLSANTTYAVFKPATSAFVELGVTSSDNQDDTSDADWSIENTLERFRDSAWSAFSLSLVLRIRLNGDVAVDRATVDSVAVTSTPLLTWPAWPDSPSPNTYGPGETIEFTATFSEAVAVTGDPEFAFLLGKTVRRAAYHAAASTARRLVFRHTVLSAERDADGISVGAYPQERVAGRVETFMLDADDRIVTVSSSEDALLSHNALGTLRRHRVGAPPVAGKVTSATITSTPRLTSMGSTTPDTYGLGEVIEFTVAFDRDVTVPGRPQFEFTLGDATRQARYDAAASTARRLVFRYTVAAGDSDADGIRVAGRTTAFNVDGDYFIVANGV